MRYAIAVLVVVVLFGCEDGPVEPIEESPVTVLRTLPSENPTVSLVDLNENGQALWLEDGRVTLWDNGNLAEPISRPVASVPTFSLKLGPNGKILAINPENVSSLLWDGEEVLEFSDSFPMGFTEDGTAYINREGEILAWNGSTLQPTELPAEGYHISQDGRIFDRVDGPGPSAADFICRMWNDGEWTEWDFGRIGCVWTATAGNGVALMWGASGYIITGASNEEVHVGRASDVNSSAQALIEGDPGGIWENGNTSPIDADGWFLHGADALNDRGEVLALGENPEGVLAIILIETR